MQTSNSPKPIDAQPVLDLALSLGFGLIGIAPAKPSENGDCVRHWIGDGRHGEMAYLANHLDVRLDPGKLLEGARSIICVADKHPAKTDLNPTGAAPYGKIARYAWGDDYHKTLKKRLHRLADALAKAHPGQRFRSTVDTAPILEREHAAQAGLGWIGKHTLLIHPAYGSYFMLGTILTTLNLKTTQQAGYPEPTVPPTDHCGTCTRCIDACPTGCITDPGPPDSGGKDSGRADSEGTDFGGIDSGGRSVDAARCISYLTLEHRSAIDPALHAQMGDWISGCDICQEVCPHNREQGSGFSNPDPRPGDQSRLRLSELPIDDRYTPRPPAPGLSLRDILAWTEDDRREVFKGSALKRIKLDMLKRNALIAAGNALAQREDAQLRKRIDEIESDAAEPPMVRFTARQVLDRLERGKHHASE